MARIIEIRTYTLHPGAAAEYERLFDVEAAPLLARHGIDVVAFGASIGDPLGYYLIRAFDDLAHRQRSEDAFYGSAEWRDGPRQAVIALIASYADLVLELDEATIDGLRRALR
ncbi:MAG: NIPSNAP family protein [Chloroflexi bacterium]|nr:NIPSNAP family protein [Chloroflexota bacterium]